jgi:hypothetical protein
MYTILYLFLTGSGTKFESLWTDIKMPIQIQLKDDTFNSKCQVFWAKIQLNNSMGKEKYEKELNK